MRHYIYLFRPRTTWHCSVIYLLCLISYSWDAALITDSKTCQEHVSHAIFAAGPIVLVQGFVPGFHVVFADPIDFKLELRRTQSERVCSGTALHFISYLRICIFPALFNVTRLIIGLTKGLLLGWIGSLFGVVIEPQTFWWSCTQVQNILWGWDTSSYCRSAATL